MSNGFPCPNPACSHVFPAAAVAGAAVLTCPRCATVFQFQAGAAAVASGATTSPSPRTVMPAPPPPNVPLASPVVSHPEPAPAPSGHGIDFGAADVLSPAAIRLRARRARPWGGKTFVGVGLFLAAVGFVIVLAARWENFVPQKKAPPKRTGEDTIFAGLNFRYQIPTRGWWQDDKTKDRLRHARLVLNRHSPASWFAILVKDYKVRNPRPREMYAEAVHVLEQHFKEHLESELRDNVTFLDRPAQVLVFNGQANKQRYSGECWMFGHQGFAYWVLAWAAGEGQKQLEGDFADLRRRFTLGDERKTWGEKHPARREFVVQKANCRLTDTEALWEEAQAPAAEFDKDAVLVLHAREQDLGAEGDAKLNVRIGATVMVLVLPPAGGTIKDAVDQARAHLLAHHKDRYKDLYPDTALEPLSDRDRPPNEVSAVGNARGHLGFVRVRNSETVSGLVVQAVIPRAENTLVIQGDCHWNQRTFWEDSLLQLVNSLQVGAP